MTINVGDVVHLSQVFAVDGSNAVVGADYELENAGTATTDFDLVSTLINDNWTPNFIVGVWQPANADGVLASCVKVQKILPNPEEDFIFEQGIAGGLATDWLPAHAAMMITKTGKSTGPGSSGRSFFPAPPEAHFDSGRLNVAGEALWSAVASYLNDVISDGVPGTVWAPQHVQSGGVFTDVFRTWPNPNVRTVRSRQAIRCPV